MLTQVAQTKPAKISNANDTHYATLMAAGLPEIPYSEIGERSIGYDKLTRRALMSFGPITVGVRVETALGEGALANPNLDRIMAEWHKDPRRLMIRSARECATDPRHTFGEMGYVVLRSLTGKKPHDAEQLFDSVMPPDIAAQPLVDVLDHLTSSTYDLSDPRFQLHQELLQAGQRAKTYFDSFTDSIRSEVEIAASTGKGLRSLGPATKGLFREVAGIEPAEVKTRQTAELGKEIGKAVAEVSQQQLIPNLADLVAQLVEQKQIASGTGECSKPASGINRTKQAA